jgi:hypothetical protein
MVSGGADSSAEKMEAGKLKIKQKATATAIDRGRDEWILAGVIRWFLST